jgi:DNA-binding transcriptional LysR family regulator
LVDFHQAYPGVALVVSLGNSSEVVKAVIRGDIELGFVEGPEEEFQDPRLAIELIARDDLVMVVSANYPWASREKLTADDLTAGKWVLREQGSGTRPPSSRLDALGVPYGNLNIAIELPSNEAVLAAVLAGVSATILSARVCADAMKAGTLKRLPVSMRRGRFTPSSMATVIALVRFRHCWKSSAPMRQRES